MEEPLIERDEYPLRAATFTACHAKVISELKCIVTCEVCGDVSNLPGCPLRREIPK